MSHFSRFLALLVLSASFSFADKVRTEGAAVGEFTMDLAAAKALAKEKNLPILLDFTGSDWCSWCKTMEKAVFSKPEWPAYAKDKLVLVTIDFPQNESLVPAKWRERNEELASKYKVEGFPTYVLLDSAAERELGRLGAGRDKTPASFGAEIDAVLKDAAAPQAAEPETEAATASVTPGKWTTDFKAAKAYAAEHDKPLFLNFTGSDWCYWCKVMHKNIFAKDEWTEWAKDNVVLVEIDFPSDKSSQPKELRDANRELQKSFNVRGYPTFVLLRPDGTTEAGRLGAGRDKTPASFIKEVAAVLSPAAGKTDDKPTTEAVAAGDEEIMLEGAEMGKWTMDLEAAKTLAGQKGVPVFLDFTGSDWCGWCKLMQKSVFSKPEWTAWAKDNLVLVTIDFPKDTSKVPADFQTRNRELQQKFGVRGYPTYVMLDPATDKELGRLGAGRDKTPASFIKEVEKFLMFIPSQVEKFAATLDGDGAKAYLAAHDQLQQAKKDLADAEARMESAKKAMHDIRANKTADAPADEPEPEPEADEPAAEDDDQAAAEDKPAAKPAAAHAVMTKGHQPGKWTMDYDAARDYAKENNKSLLINFTGSDWCGWCKLMDKNVFAADAWSAYAKDNLALATIDFPNDKAIVPESYVERNEKLKADYGVRGFPTYVLIAADGSEIGRLGAGRDKTPESFITEVDDLLALTPAGIEAYVKDLSADDANAYRQAVSALQAAQSAEREYQANAERTPEGMKKMMALGAKVGVAEDQLRHLKATHAAADMGDKAANFLAAHEALTAANQDLRDFLAGLPERNEENNQRFQKLMGAVKAAQAKIDELGN